MGQIVVVNPLAKWIKSLLRNSLIPLNPFPQKIRRLKMAFLEDLLDGIGVV